MAFCSNCGAEVPEGSTTCPSCQATVVANTVAVKVDAYDHTAEFEASDVESNKIYAMCAYLFSVLGLAIIFLGAKESPYAMFHAKQALKLLVSEVLVTIIMMVLCWTCIVPIAGIIVLLIIFVLYIIAIVQVMMGKAKEPWMIRSLKFLGK